MFSKMHQIMNDKDSSFTDPQPLPGQENMALAYFMDLDAELPRIETYEKDWPLK